ncbi:MAG: cation:proton antiporter [Steroidobacteraceae bacterium]
MDASAATHSAQTVLANVAVILLSGSVAGLLAHRLRIPDIVLFLLAGIALGPTGIGAVDVAADSAFNQLILLFGASYILFDGGATLRLPVLKEIWITVVAIATAGVLITGAVVAAAAHYLLTLPAAGALLLGAALAPTDPATLVPIFRQVKVRDRVAQMVISESALNDAMGAIFTLAVLGVALGGDFQLSHSARAFLWDSCAGIGLGLALGLVATFLIHHRRAGFLEEYLPLVTLMVVIGAYLSADRLNASGFMAVFVAGVVVGNPPAWLRDPSERRELSKLDDFVASTALVMRMFIFILLGSQVNFPLLLAHAWPALAIVLVLMFVARPAAVFLCAPPDRRARWSTSELVFMCWTRETGVIPAALGGMILSARAPHAELITGVIFMAVLVTIALQAPTTRWLARRLGILAN